MRLLIVEDAPRLRTSLEQAFAHSGYVVDAAEDGPAALAYVRNQTYDAVVLDVMLPGLDGFHVLATMRREGHTTPVLCLTARDALEDKLKGLKTGADDYLVKPFELRELLARVHALCRRRYNQYGDTLRVADLELDRKGRKVTRKGQDIPLQAREFALLEYLMLRPGEVIERREIEAQLYDDLSAPESNAVDAAIYALRKKLANYRGAPALIHTRRGQGYLLVELPA